MSLDRRSFSVWKLWQRAILAGASHAALSAAHINARSQAIVVCTMVAVEPTRFFNHELSNECRSKANYLDHTHRPFGMLLCHGPSERRKLQGRRVRAAVDLSLAADAWVHQLGGGVDHAGWQPDGLLHASDWTSERTHARPQRRAAQVVLATRGPSRL